MSYILTNLCVYGSSSFRHTADITSPGCHFCHMTLQPCLASISHKYRGEVYEKKANSSLDLIIPEPALPEEIKTWLEHRQDRYRRWSRKEGSWTFTTRVDSCAGHVSGYRYLTTGYSLDGELCSVIIFDISHFLQVYQVTHCTRSYLVQTKLQIGLRN